MTIKHVVHLVYDWLSLKREQLPFVRTRNGPLTCSSLWFLLAPDLKSLTGLHNPAETPPRQCTEARSGTQET